MRMFAIAVVAVAVVLPSRPATACKCEHPSIAAAARRADAVFAGEIVAVRRGGKVDAIDVAVDAVWKGTVAATVIVESTASSCGLVTGGATAGRRFVFVARRDGATLRVRQCDGSRRDTRRVRAQATRALGAPRPPA
jgi:hypothetical protein